MRSGKIRTDDRRIGIVERDVAATKIEVSATKVEVSNLTQSFNQFSSDVRSDMRSLFNKIDAGSQTNWGVLVTGAGVALTAILSFSALMLEPVKAKVSANEARIEKFYELRIEDAYQRGQLEERVVSQAREIDELKKRFGP